MGERVWNVYVEEGERDFKVVFIYLRSTERSQIFSSPLQCLEQLRPGHAQTGGWKFYPGLPHEWHMPSYLRHHHCCPESALTGVWRQQLGITPSPASIGHRCRNCLGKCLKVIYFIVLGKLAIWRKKK